MRIVLTSSPLSPSLESLAVTSQAFRRSADRVRKASFKPYSPVSTAPTYLFSRICGMYLPSSTDSILDFLLPMKVARYEGAFLS